MITVLCGKSASGKDTILRELKKEGFEPLISTTSRPMRDGEQEGREYYFVSREEFEKRLEEGKFIEHRAYDTLVGGHPDTWYYGMEKINLDMDRNYVVVLDLDGTEAFQKAYGRENIFSVYVDCPDEVRTKRAKHRGSFDETEWNRRLVDDNVKFSEDRVAAVCDITLDNTDRTIRQLVDDFLDRKCAVCAEWDKADINEMMER
jgi:guanylate kinase